MLEFPILKTKFSSTHHANKHYIHNQYADIFESVKRVKAEMSVQNDLTD